MGLNKILIFGGEYRDLAQKLETPRDNSQISAVTPKIHSKIYKIINKKPKKHVFVQIFGHSSSLGLK